MDAIYHEITTSLFMVAPSHARACFELALLARQGKLDFNAWFSTIDDQKKAFANAIDSAAKAFAGNVNIANYWELDNIQIPDGSIGVVPVYGPLYSWRTQEIQSMIQQAQANPRISSIIMPVQSPGGSIIGIDATASAVAACDKPIHVAVMGLCCSAAYWISSGADRIWTTSKTDIIGSIGVMTTYADFLKYYEEAGIKVEDIYATKSTEKNNDYRAWTAGDDKPVKETLDYIMEVFQSAVMAGRKMKDSNDAFKGNTYFPDQAKALSLVDGIQSLQGILLSLSLPTNF